MGAAQFGYPPTSLCALCVWPTWSVLLLQMSFIFGSAACSTCVPNINSVHSTWTSNIGFRSALHCFSLPPIEGKQNKNKNAGINEWLSEYKKKLGRVTIMAWRSGPHGNTARASSRAKTQVAEKSIVCLNCETQLRSIVWKTRETIIPVDNRCARKGAASPGGLKRRISEWKPPPVLEDKHTRCVIPARLLKPWNRTAVYRLTLLLQVSPEAAAPVKAPTQNWPSG